MKLTVISVVGIVAVGALLAAPAIAQNSLQVTSVNPISGVYSLEMLLANGSSNASYVETDAPNQETGIRIEFKIDVNNFDIDWQSNQTLRVGKGISSVLPPQGSSREHLIIFVKKNPNTGGNYSLRVMAQQNFGFFGNCAQNFLVFPGGPPKTIAVEWVQGTGPQGSQDGRCSVFIDGVLIDEKTNLNTSGFDVNSFRMGIFQPSFGGAGIGGSFLLDDAVLTRVN